MIPPLTPPPPHVHECGVCHMGLTWCCAHRKTMAYIAVVVTLLLISSILELVLW